jgi:alpha-amylase
MSRILLLSLALLLASCATTKQNSNAAAAKMPFVWENANLYFLLTDRFNNGNPANDLNFGRTDQTAPLRGFMGGDIAGITKKIEEGYFDKLGVTALWFTPVVEQIHGSTDEGTGVTYGFHGYWTKDWTALDPNFGTEKDLMKLIETAHQHGIRVVLDVVINHTGPVTPADPVWPADWVRTEPACTYKNYETTTACTLVKNLPDIRTESNKAVELPPALVEKWKAEGRYEKEMAELEAFFARTGYPRAAKYYIIKWLTDYIRKYGADGFRCDTAKHLEESVWADLRKEADLAFADWKKANPKKVLDANPFYMVGEVYFYNINNGRNYDFGDKKVDYFNNGFSSLINFGIKGDATADYETLFAKYSKLLQKQLAGKTVLNYMTSHDDGEPFDKMRTKPFETGTKLLLCPGGAQIYYGDETARPLTFEGAQGDANLRTFMNWDDVKNNAVRNGVNVREVLAHWQKLGQFRRAHPAVGAGVHEMLSAKPYVFKRTYEQGKRTDIVIVGLDQPKGPKSIDLRGLYPEGMMLTDYYSGSKIKVTGGKATLNTPFEIVLLGK